MNVRNYRFTDLPLVVEFMNRDAEAKGKFSRTTTEQIEQSWHAPHNNPENDIFVACDGDDVVHGYVIADLLDDPGLAYGVYHVTQGDTETGRALMKAATDYFLELASQKAPPESPIMLDWRLSEKNTDAIALCEENGCQQVRQFYTMRIALDEPLDDVPLPEGFIRRPFIPDDLEAVYGAKVEMFSDHWGGQHDTIDSWRSSVEATDFDPALWWIIDAGDHNGAHESNGAGESIAGLLTSNIWTEKTAWIGIVGVRQAWRKRGLAQALLRQCFAEYQRRGFHDVQLGVDTNNSTNAVKVYERAGMHVYDTVLYYRHVLREAKTSSG